MTDRHPRLTPLATGLPATVPFVGPEAQERARGRRFVARIGANENVFGASPNAIDAMAQAASSSWMYGDPENHDLRHALAQHHGIPAENIMVGEGVDALLGYLVRLIVSPGTLVVTSDGAYPTFSYHVAGYGGALVKVPYRNDHEDAPALVQKARDTGARLIYLANPDNPMGTWLDARQITAAINAVAPGALLVLDEAYLECAPTSAAPPLDPSDSRVIRFRTFSKAYGMAGARVGYAIGHADLIAAFNKVRNHFAVPRISQAGALAALADQPYLAQTLKRIAQSRDAIAALARTNGLTPLASGANFVAIDCGQDGDFARRVLGELISRDIFVRMPFIAPQDRTIRISCGRPADIEHLAAALPEALETARR